MARATPRQQRRLLPIALGSAAPFPALNGEIIGLEQVDDVLWNILYYDTLLGRYDEHKRRITGVPALRAEC